MLTIVSKTRRKVLQKNTVCEFLGISWESFFQLLFLRLAGDATGDGYPWQEWKCSQSLEWLRVCTQKYSHHDSTGQRKTMGKRENFPVFLLHFMVQHHHILVQDPHFFSFALGLTNSVTDPGVRKHFKEILGSD